MSSNEIPKIIWQTHEWDYDDLPPHFKGTSSTWRNLNPDWEYRYLNAKQREDYVRNNHYLLYKIYKLHDKISQADIWRYIATYEEGGVYADMDSVCTVPLTYMLDTRKGDAELVAMEVGENQKIINNSHFAITKNSAIMKAIIDNAIVHYKKTDFIQMLMNYEVMDEFWEEFAHIIRLNPQIYYEVLERQPPGLVSYGFMTDHSDRYKTSFDHDYPVNYYGETVSYFDLAKKYGWETYIPQK